MTEPNKQDQAPPVAIYRALRQIEEMLTSSAEAISVCSLARDSVLGQKREFLKTSLLVRKYWEHLPEAYFAPLLRAAIYEADPSWNLESGFSHACLASLWASEGARDALAVS